VLLTFVLELTSYLCMFLRIISYQSICLRFFVMSAERKIRGACHSGPTLSYGMLRENNLSVLISWYFLSSLYSLPEDFHLVRIDLM
jgi:hypothetical protein